jgi:hypothetical protein
MNPLGGAAGAKLRADGHRPDEAVVIRFANNPLARRSGPA